MKVDVVLLTKNSLKPCLKKCLRSIYSNIPVNRVIVVDGGSNDGTLDLLRKFPNVKIINDLNGNRATARQKGIDAVETEWFVFVDSDVVLSDGWFTKALSNIDDCVGAVQGIDVPIGDWRISIFGRSMKKLRQILRKPIKGTPSSIRGFTGDTLIKTSLVKDIKIPKFLHFYEDQFIRMHIEKKGYKWVICRDPFCYHIKTLDEMIEDAFPSGYFQIKMRYIDIRKSLIASFTIFPKSAFVSLLTGRFTYKWIKFQLLYTIGAMKAWLH